MPKLIDLRGFRHGRLVFLKRTDSPSRRRVYWEAACDCGNVVRVRSDVYKKENYVSCGCFHSELVSETGKLRVKHGAKRGGEVAPEYRCWVGMIGRCENPKATKYSRYGGRGIKVCERWRNSFSDFLSDMGPKPSASASIDRINNDGDYEPGNCRWAEPVQQANNRCSSIVIEYGGTKQTASQWARSLGMKPLTLLARVRRGWSTEKALTTPKR